MSAIITHLMGMANVGMRFVLAKCSTVARYWASACQHRFGIKPGIDVCWLVFVGRLSIKFHGNFKHEQTVQPYY